MTIGERIRQLREEKELTQDELSVILDTKRATLGNWETGRAEPNAEMIVKIANHFNVSINYLMGKTNKVEDRIYKIIGSSGDLSEEEWLKIFDRFEDEVALFKMKREKKG